MSRHLRRAIVAYAHLRAYCNGRVEVRCDVYRTCRIISVAYHAHGASRPMLRYVRAGLQLDPMKILAELLGEIEEAVALPAVKAAIVTEIANLLEKRKTVVCYDDCDQN